MEEHAKKIQRWDLEVQKTKKLPQYLCTNFDCDKGEEPNLAEHIEEMNNIKALLAGLLEDREKIAEEYKKMMENMESVDEYLKDTLKKFKPLFVPTTNILKDFPEYAD